MTMRARHALPIAALALVGALTGCDTGGPAAPTPETFTATNIPTQNSVDPAGRCAPAQTLNIHGTGASSLGALTVEQSHCFDAQSANPLAFWDGEFAITLDEGGRFHGTYAGSVLPTANPAVFQINAQWTVTHGTGGFAGATGSGTATGEANLQTQAGSVSLQGTIRK
jgi:hypothetical protein